MRGRNLQFLMLRVIGRFYKEGEELGKIDECLPRGGNKN